MITTPALVFATVAFSAVCSFGAPVKVRRDGSDVQQIGRRFPQPVAEDAPPLVKKEVIDTPVADAIARRFPRRVYYEYYSKRETPEVAERSTAPESVPEARSIADEASDELVARNRRRQLRRSSDSTLYKRTLQKDGVVTRREEPKMKRSVVSQPVVAREPEPEPQPAPVVESVQPVAPRDTFIWNINAGIKVEEITDVKQIQKISGLPVSGSVPASTGSTPPTGEPAESRPSANDTLPVAPPANGTTGNETGATNSTGQTPPPNENPPATGKGEQGSPSTATPSPTSTQSGSKSASTTGSGPAENGSPSNGTAVAVPCTNPEGCPTPSGTASSNPPNSKPVVKDTTVVPPGTEQPTTGSPGKREEPSPPLVMRSGSMHWRRVPSPPSSPPLNRRSESASSRLQFRREHS